jgi:hypothetical protein
MQRRWDIRHRRTNVLIGQAVLDIPEDRLRSNGFEWPYFLAVWSPMDLLRAPPTTSDIITNGPRRATVWINPRRLDGGHTLWVDKASELVGLPSFDSNL